jgi:hypothetical protein
MCCLTLDKAGKWPQKCTAGSVTTLPGTWYCSLVGVDGRDVDKHVERVGKAREQLDKRGDRRKLVGAVVRMIMTKEVRKYAQEKGL